MKIYHWITLVALAVCLGCGSDEPKEPALGSESTTQAQKPLHKKATDLGATDNVQSGGQKAEGPSSTAAGTPDMAAKKILEKMVSVYKNATSYSDQGQIRLSAKIMGPREMQPVALVAPISVALERPNRFLICANKGTAVCDGTTLYEYVESLPNQVLKKPAPKKLTIEAIFTEPILADEMAQGPTQYYTWIPIQAVLLLANDPLKTLLYNVDQIELLVPGTIGDRQCRRVKIHRHDGEAIFWIDAESFVLRRFEYPLEGIKRDFQQGEAEDLKVVAEFQNAKIDAEVDQRTFSFQPPKKVQIVDRLAPLQIHMLGKRAPEFFFTGVDNKPITLKSLAGKTIVINFWASWSMQCRNSLSLVSQMAQRLKDDDRIVFLACSTDRMGISNQDLQKVMREMGVSLPIYRDPENFAQKGFHISGVPTIVVIGPKGVIQEYRSNFFSRRHGMLPQAVYAVAEGKNVFRRQLSMFEVLCSEYDRVIQKMLHEDLFIDPKSIFQIMPLPGVARQSDPQRSKVMRIWHSQEVGTPGNIVVLEDAQPPKILVCHDSRRIAELSIHGELIKDYAFKIPEDKAITKIRPGKTAEGQRFYVGFAPGARQCFLLDENFNVKWKFPKATEQGAPSGIADIQVADLNGDGTPEIFVGYRGEVGVKAVSLQGNLLWSNREVTGITKMALAPKTPNHPDWLLCTTDKYSLVGLDGQGKIAKKFDLGHRRFYWIATSQLNASGPVSLCGLSAPDIGENEAFGISLGGAPLWNYQLPDGSMGMIINRVIAGKIFPLQEAQWVLLGADSSIHIVSEQGQPIDSFSYGSFVAGIATVKIGGKQVLLISSLNGVEAIVLESVE